jgi:hypothetical protein
MVAASAGNIEEPANGAVVGTCGRVNGSARLAAGKTVVFALRNLDGNESDRWYARVPGDWETRSNLPRWEGLEWYPGAVGQHYEFGLFAVDFDSVKRSRRNGTEIIDNIVDDVKPLDTRRIKQGEGGCDQS